MPTNCTKKIVLLLLLSLIHRILKTYSLSDYTLFIVDLLTNQTVILIVFSCFFQDLCEFVIHCNKHDKRHTFLCLFVLFEVKPSL